MTPTASLLAAKYSNDPIIPLAAVAKDHFGMTADKFLRKVLSGEIKLPIVYLNPASQKGARGVALIHLAAFLDRRIAAAEKECQQLNG